MRYIFFLLFIFLGLFSCKKEKEVMPTSVTKITQDSMVRSIHKDWKFTVVVSNTSVSSKLSNWEDWRNYVNELTIPPNASLSQLVNKSGNLVQKVAVLKATIPESYNKQETKARLSLLETNVQTLDMLLGLEPLNVKEISQLLASIQKNTNSIVHQLDEFEIKAKIPKEIGESELLQPIDTIKRATLNAIPKE